MATFFVKPIDQISDDDIFSLQGTPEGQIFEIKSQLPAPKGKQPDQWLKKPLDGEHRAGPSDYAKQNIFEELVAFANMEGGWLVIGLTETNDRPKRVDKIAPIPDCHELADRLERASQDWIDPPVPSLRCRGIEIGATAGEGVVVCRATRSPLAPHRLNKKGVSQEAYKRVGEQSKQMSMREIQDMALDRARGQAAIDAAFEENRKKYEVVKPLKSKKLKLIGFQIILVPVAGPLAIDRPYLHKELFERDTLLKGMSMKEIPYTAKTIDYNSLGASHLGPILRGGRQIWSRTFSSDIPGKEQADEDISVVEVSESGVVSLSAKTTQDPPGLHLNWILADLANALRIAERARTLGGNPDAEYAMEIEARYDKIGLDGKFAPMKDEIPLCLVGDEERYPMSLGCGPVRLPRYFVGRRDEFSGVLMRVLNDVYNSVQRPHEEDIEFDLFPSESPQKS